MEKKTGDRLIKERASYCKRRNFRTQFSFVYFVLRAESMKISSIRKPCTYTNVCDTALTVRKFIAYESSQSLKYDVFTRTEISTNLAATPQTIDDFILCESQEHNLCCVWPFNARG